VRRQWTSGKVIIIGNVAQVVHDLGNRGSVLFGEGLLGGVPLVGDGCSAGIPDGVLKLVHAGGEGHAGSNGRSSCSECNLVLLQCRHKCEHE
jgi:hypothetical protein